MVVYEDMCVGCPPEMGCLGSSCPNRNVERWYCDECGEETFPEDSYEINGGIYCKYCYMNNET